MKKVNPSSVQYRQTVFGGKDEVTYDCPECNQSLKSPLSDAGIQDYCPHCECEFIVPGSEEKERKILAMEAKRLKNQQAKDEEQLKERQQAKRLKEQQAKEEERLKALKAKGRTSNHYMSLGFMYLVSVITKIFLIVLLSGLGTFVAVYIGSGFGLVVYLACLFSNFALLISLFIDVFCARNAFKKGSDPSKTAD
jgi:Zn-finger nucleic acid-binding protein